MDHEKIKDLLSAYLDDELTEQQHNEVSAHLAVCQECQDEITQFEKLEEFSNKYSTVSEEEKYWEKFPGRIINQISQEIVESHKKEAEMFRDSFIKD